MALLTQLNQQGMTVVVVTHEPDVAAYASRTITFKDGKIIDDSPSKKVGLLGGLS
jgi:putative ABC transport system ATP-binding protein